MEVNVNKITREKRKHPKLDDYKTTFKLFLKKKSAAVGFFITMLYFIFAILDYAYPRYLGVSSYTSLESFKVHYSSATPLFPSLNHGFWYLLGTTQLDSEKFALLPSMLGALRFDIGYSVLIVAVGSLIGIFLGTFSATYGKYFDEAIMRITDIFFSFPYLVLVFAFLFVLGAKPVWVVLALIVVWWPIYARLSRSQALFLRSTKFVEAAYASGSSRLRNVFSHIIPNVLSPVFVQFSLDLGSIVQIFAALAFLQVGLGPHFDELGNIIYLGETYLGVGIWWPIVIPGVFLLIFTVSVNLMGDGLRDVLDPKLRR